MTGEATYRNAVDAMARAVLALPRKRQGETFELLAAHLDSVTAGIAQHRRRRPRQGVVSSCRPVATHTPEGGARQ